MAMKRVPNRRKIQMHLRAVPYKDWLAFKKAALDADISINDWMVNAGREKLAKNAGDGE